MVQALPILMRHRVKSSLTGAVGRESAPATAALADSGAESLQFVARFAGILDRRTHQAAGEFNDCPAVARLGLRAAHLCKADHHERGCVEN